MPSAEMNQRSGSAEQVAREHRGSPESLCGTCQHLVSCAFRKDRPEPVMFCEHFEDGPWGADHMTTIITKHAGQRGGLIAVLEAIQAKFGYLPEASLETVAKQTGRSLVDIYGVATFFKAFSLKPRGKHLCSVCLGTACHVRGAPVVAKEFEQRLGVEAGATTEDREFTLDTVSCLGACALGPVVVVDGHYFPQVGTRKVAEILDKTRVGLDHVEVEHDERIFPVDVCCARCNRSLMDNEHSIEGYPSMRVTISFGNKHGWLRMSSLYGSYTIESKHKIPEETVAHFFCPFCHAELTGATDCPTCSAPMVPLIVRGGGLLQICSRRGCKIHMLDLTGASL